MHQDTSLQNDASVHILHTPQLAMTERGKLKRNDDRVIIHFVSLTPPQFHVVCAHNKQDYDCFYASVFEHENPSLKSLPLVSILRTALLYLRKLTRQKAVQQVTPLTKFH